MPLRSPSQHSERRAERAAEAVFCLVPLGM